MSALRNIVRMVSSPEEVRERNKETLVVLDAKTLQVVPKPSFLTKMLSRPVIYYAVTTGQRTEYRAAPVVIQRGSGLDGLELTVHCRLSCKPGDEGRLATIIAAANNPESALEQCIAEAATAYERTKNSMPLNQRILALLQDRDEWQKHIAKAVRDQVGFQAEIKIGLPAGCLDRIELNQEFAEVHVPECPDALMISFEAHLEIDPQQKVKAVAYYCHPQHLGPKLLEEFRKFLGRHVKLDEFFELNILRKKLEPQAKTFAARHGRDLTHFRIRTQAPFEAPEFKMENVTHQVQLQNMQEKITVTHAVLLKVNDLAVFRLNFPKPGDVFDWLKKNLEAITQEMLFGKSYSDVVTEFTVEKRPAPAIGGAANTPTLPAGSPVGTTELQESIRQNVRSRLAKYGLDVTHFSSVPGLKEMELLKGFRLEIDGEFKTKNTRVPVKLTIVCDGRLTSLERVKVRLTPSVDLRKDMEAKVRNVVQSRLDGMKPERFYLNFEANYSAESAGAAITDAKSVELELSESVKLGLLDEFNADCQIIIKQIDTDLTNRIRGLLNSRPRLRIQAIPHDSLLPITFDVPFRVVAVVPEFLASFMGATYPNVEAEIQDLTRFLEDAVNSKVNFSAPARGLTFVDAEHRDLLRDVLFGEDGVLDLVRTHYGLVVEITGFERGLTKSEEARRTRNLAALVDAEQAAQRETQRRLERLEIVEEQIARVYQAGDMSDPRLAELKAEQESLEKLRTRAPGEEEVVRAGRMALPEPRAATETDPLKIVESLRTSSSKRNPARLTKRPVDPPPTK